jgi:aldehyde dehydrogenase (NAD+)
LERARYLYAIARGNTVVLIPSEPYPLSLTDFYQVLDTSDVPGGVVDIVNGNRDHLVKTLIQHEDVDGVWYFGTAEGSHHAEYESAVNMKRTWGNYGIAWNWLLFMRSWSFLSFSSEVRP